MQAVRQQAAGPPQFFHPEPEVRAFVAFSTKQRITISESSSPEGFRRVAGGQYLPNETTAPLEEPR